MRPLPWRFVVEEVTKEQLLAKVNGEPSFWDYAICWSVFRVLKKTLENEELIQLARAGECKMAALAILTNPIVLHERTRSGENLTT